jgi:predicted dehydrogenase
MPSIAVIGVAHPHVEYVLGELTSLAGEYTVIGVQDRDQALAARYAAPFRAPTFERVEALLALRPDVVMIAGRYVDRGGDAVAALRAGAHVIADKPLCTSLDHLDDLERAVRESDRSVTLLLEKRGYPETLAAQEAIDAGRLGDIVGITTSGPHKLNAANRPDWFLRRSDYGGILGDLAVHDLDAALLFAPAASAVVRGWTTAEHPEGFARYGVASVVTPTAVITAEVSWLTPQGSDVHGDYRMRVVGTTGSLEIFWARGRVELTTEDSRAYDLALPPARLPALDALVALADGTQSASSTRDALAVTRLALLAQYSADHGGESRVWTRDLD